MGGFVVAYGIAKFLGEDSAWFSMHMILGLTLGWVVLLRLGWGFVGTRWARWSSFWHRPQDFVAYFRTLFRKGGRSWGGHNPAASASAILLLVSVAAVAGSGYFTSLGLEWAEDLHPLLVQALLVLALLHIAGVVLHQVVHRDHTILGMVDGTKVTDPLLAIPSARPWAGVALAVLIGGFFSSLAASMDPSRSSTRWPLTGIPIQLSGEGSERESHEQDSHHRQGRESEAPEDRD